MAHASPAMQLRVFECLAKQGSGTPQQIADRLKLGAATVNKALWRLMRHRAVTRNDWENSNVAYVYTAAPVTPTLRATIANDVPVRRKRAAYVQEADLTAEERERCWAARDPNCDCGSGTRLVGNGDSRIACPCTTRPHGPRRSRITEFMHGGTHAMVAMQDIAVGSI